MRLTSKPRSTFSILFYRCALALLLLSIAPSTAIAQPVTIDIYGPGQSKMGIALAQPLAANAAPAPAAANTLQDLLRQNLKFMPFLQVLPDSSILGGTRLDGFTEEKIDFKRFQLVGSDLLITAGWPQGEAVVELRCFQTFTRKLLVGKSYSSLNAKQLPVVADKFCEALMEKLTGHGEFFRSTLAFIKKQGADSNVFAVRPTGRDLRQLTKLKGDSLSPEWSPDAKFITFSHIDGRYHSLGLINLSSNKVRTMRFKGNTIIGPTFAGGQIALSISQGENPNIYLLSKAFSVERALVKSGSIDVSPSFDRTGSKMAFVSDRAGNPQVYLSEGGQTRRLTYEGGYNTDPSMSPAGDFVAYTRRTSEGYRIFMHDLETGEERQVSFGPGNDEQPAFAPDSYFIAYSSTRAGGRKIFLTTRHGAEPILVPTGGNGSFPSWGLRR